MAYYRITIKRKVGNDIRAIRQYEEPYPLVEKEVHRKAGEAFPGNVKEILITKLSVDHPEVQRFIKGKPKK